MIFFLKSFKIWNHSFKKFYHFFRVNCFCFSNRLFLILNALFSLFKILAKLNLKFWTWKTFPTPTSNSVLIFFRPITSIYINKLFKLLNVLFISFNWRLRIAFIFCNFFSDKLWCYFHIIMVIKNRFTILNILIFFIRKNCYAMYWRWVGLKYISTNCFHTSNIPLCKVKQEGP